MCFFRCKYHNKCENYSNNDYTCEEAPDEYHYSCFRRKRKLLLKELITLLQKRSELSRQIYPIDLKIAKLERMLDLKGENNKMRPMRRRI